MLRDWVPEEKGVPEVLVRPDRDFIPEGGLTRDQAKIGKSERRYRDDPPEGAPLLEKDFIHEVVIEGADDNVVEVGSGLGARGSEHGDFTHEEKPKPTKGELAEAATRPQEDDQGTRTIPEVERPPFPRKESTEPGGPSPEPEFEVPPGYELRGHDEETGEPIIRRKSGRLSKEEQAAKERWEKEQAEAGAKGGESRGRRFR